MSKYLTYPEYLSWSNKWINKLPKSWLLVPLKYLCSGYVKDGPHETPKFLDFGIPFLSVDGIQNNKLAFDGCRYISSESHQRYAMKCHPKKGDVLLGKAASVGKVAYVDSDINFNVWSPLAVITAKSNSLGRYIYYCFQSSMLQAQCEVFSNSNTQKNLGMNTIDNLDFPYPTENEAKCISSFLDHETAKIDTLIEKQQQLIKLLREKRQAVISHAVTKGLNPQAPMKDSGVEWLGEVPEHWSVCTLKRHAKFIDGDRSSEYPNDKDLKENGVLFLSSKNISNGKLNIKNASFISFQKFERLNRGKAIDGDLIVKVRGSTGRIGELAVFEADRIKYSTAFINAQMMIIRVDASLNNYFLSNIAQAHYWMEQLNIGAYGTAQQQLNNTVFANVVMVVPPLCEQKEINAYLRHVTNHFDSLINKATSAIELMQERRTALISAAVTGKIDVRNWEQPND